LKPHLPQIDRHFDQTTVEAIFKSLEADAKHDEWSAKTLEALRKMSPTSLKITHRQLRAGAALNFDKVFQMEYRISQHIMAAKSDFIEGVRAGEMNFNFCVFKVCFSL
jgi:enoyl-CoA hydratase/carnithine racemase